MPNPQQDITQIPSNRVEIIDSKTGMVSREWYRFFLNLFNLAGAGGNQTSLDDLQIGPPPQPATASGNVGTVTSVDVSGGTTGLTTSGGPVTSSGTITLAGTLAVGSGGTGATTAINARSNLSAAQSGANTDITSIALTSGTVTTAPSSSSDLVNKSYADSIASGVNFHAACNYATTAALASNTYNNGASGVGATLTAVAVGTLTIDGYTFVVGDVGKRILIKNEVTGANNGIYTLTQAGTALLPYILTRATDYDTSGSGTNEIDQGDLVLVLAGTTNANTSWVQQTPLPITVGTTALVFIQFAAVQTYTAGTGLTLTTNQFSITNTGTSGTYGSATAIPVFVTNAQGQVTSVTNTTATPAVGSITGLGTGVGTFLATPTSANLATAVTDETGSGSLVFATSPTLVTPILGTPQSGNFSTGTFTWPTFNQNTTGTASNVTGVVAIANGGTGQTTQQAALTALSGTQTSGQYLRSNGTNTLLSAIQAADVPTLNQNTTGTASNITASSNSTLTTLSALSLPGSQVSGNISGNAANVTGTVAVANGGTGLTTTPANGALDIGNGTGFTRTTLTAGTNVTITNASGAITINSSNPGGTVTAVSVVSANGFAGTSSGGATPALTLSTTITGVLKGNGTAISAATSGTDYSAGTSGLTTGILKSTTTTGALSIAVAGDFPTLNQNTTGSAATLTTPRAIYGNNFDGSAALTQIIASTYGGTGNGFTKFSGATTAEKTYSLPDASTTILTTNAAVTIAQGGTGQTTQQAALTALSGTQTSGQYLRSNGTNTLLSAIQAADVPTLNQNTTGTASNVTGVVAIANGGTGQTTANTAFNALAPSQTANTGKYLTTDGTNTSWATVASSSSTNAFAFAWFIR
jgi:hypothetical protein